MFDLAAARTGLRDAEATDAGLNPLTVGCTDYDHKVYYPGAEPVHVRITGDQVSGRLLGLQLVGHRSAQVAKRIYVIATAISAGMPVAEIVELDLSYTPPFGGPWDVLQLAGHAWTGQADKGMHR